MPAGVLTGKRELTVSGGSDLANLKTTAKKTNDGSAYVVNGHKVGARLAPIQREQNHTEKRA